MANYRVTVRFVAGGTRYEVLEIEAADLGEALRRAADALPAEVAATADLAEIRLQAEAELREYTPG